MENKATKQNQSDLSSLQSSQVKITDDIKELELLFNQGLKKLQQIKKMSKEQELAIKEVETKNIRKEEVQTIQEETQQNQIQALSKKEIQSITKNEQLQEMLTKVQNIEDCFIIIRDFQLTKEELVKLLSQEEINQKLKKNEKILLEKIKKLIYIDDCKNSQHTKLKTTQNKNEKETQKDDVKKSIKIDDIEKTNPTDNKGEQNKISVEDIKQIYEQNHLDVLNEELKPYSKQYHTINLDFINIMDKCYTIPNNQHYTNSYTLFEYCILLQKYRYIREYCQYKLQQCNTYTTDRYFEYCKHGNIQAIYYCIVVQGIDPEMINKEDDNTNAFIYACENKRIEMLRMMIDVFQISSEQTKDNGWTGFMYACINNKLEVVQLLIDKYPSIIEQKNNYGQTGFIYACDKNSLEVVQLLIDKYPSIIEQKDNIGCTGYDKLSKDSKQKIIEYITKRNLNVRKPKL